MWNIGKTFKLHARVYEPGHAGQEPPQSVFSSSWFRMLSSQVSETTKVNHCQSGSRSLPIVDIPLKKAKLNKRTWTSRTDTSAVNFLFVLVQNVVITGFWIKKYKIFNATDEGWHCFYLWYIKNFDTVVLTALFLIACFFLLIFSYAIASISFYNRLYSRLSAGSTSACLTTGRPCSPRSPGTINWIIDFMKLN